MSLLSLLAGGSGVTLLVFEDAHWIDPTSKLLLGRLGQWARTTCALVVATIRSDGRAAATELLADVGLVEADGFYPDNVTAHECEAQRSERKAVGPCRHRATASRSTPLGSTPSSPARRAPLYLRAAGQGVCWRLRSLGGAAGGGGRQSRPHRDRRRTDGRTRPMRAGQGSCPAGSRDRSRIRHGPAGPHHGMFVDELVPLLLDLERSKLLARGAGAPDLYRFRLTP